MELYLCTISLYGHALINGLLCPCTSAPWFHLSGQQFPSCVLLVLYRSSMEEVWINVAYGQIQAKQQSEERDHCL